MKKIATLIAAFMVSAVLVADTATFTKSYTPSKTRTPTKTRTRTFTPRSTNTPTPTPTVTTRIVKKTGGTYSTLADAVAACWVNDIIEIRDSGTYNEVFKPTKQITLRVQSGQGYAPTIGSTATGGIAVDMSGLTTTACVTILGNNGLKILGGAAAISETGECGSVYCSKIASIKCIESYKSTIFIMRTSSPAYPDTFTNCLIDVGGKSYTNGVYLYATASPNPQLVMYNCVVTQTGTGGRGVKIEGTESDHVADIVNCTIYGSKAYGVDSSCPVSIVNTSFSGNGANTRFVSPASAAASSYCAFVGTPPAGAGTSVISITAASEFENPVNNWHLKAGATQRFAGIEASGTYAITDDLDGVARPVGTPWDIGAYQWVPTGTFTVTSTKTATRTVTPTSSPTFTVTPTLTVTKTSTPTATATFTITNTPVYTTTFTAIAAEYITGRAEHFTEDGTKPIWTPAGGNMVGLLGYWIDADGANVIRLTSDGVTIRTVTFEAAGNSTVSSAVPIWTGAADDALTVESDGNTATSNIGVWGTEE